jgi:hypothetical protein
VRILPVGVVDCRPGPMSGPLLGSAPRGAVLQQVWRRRLSELWSLGAGSSSDEFPIPHASCRMLLAPRLNSGQGRVTLRRKNRPTGTLSGGTGSSTVIISKAFDPSVKTFVALVHMLLQLPDKLSVA